MAALILDLGTEWRRSGHHQAPAVLALEKDAPVPSKQEAGWPHLRSG